MFVSSYTLDQAPRWKTFSVFLKMMKEAQCTHETCGSPKEKISQDYEDFNVSTFSILGIWSLGGSFTCLE
jgi:hypothetical protein